MTPKRNWTNRILWSTRFAAIVLIAALPVAQAQDTGIRDSLIITNHYFSAPPPDSFELFLRVFTDDTLFFVSAVIEYNSWEMVATSASPGPLIKDLPGSSLEFFNYPDQGRFAVVWVGNFEATLPHGGVDLATVYFTERAHCQAGRWFDTTFIAPVMSTMFVKLHSTYVPIVDPLYYYCVGVEDDLDLQNANWQTSTAYPNPFNSGTSIEVVTTRTGRLSISVYDILGRRMRDIIEETVGSGRHVFQWDGTDESGHSAASGVYLLRVASSSGVETRKLVLLR